MFMGMRRRLCCVVPLGALLLVACKGDAGSQAPAGRAQAPGPAAGQGRGAVPCAQIAAPPARHPAAPRIVAIGDLHGDLDAARRALALAGAIDAGGHWSGGDLVLVQTGDILDRGDQERAIIDLFERLAIEARAAGGAVHVLLGNHETMNAAGDFRYVTPGGFDDFRDVAEPRGREDSDDGNHGPERAALLARVPPAMRARAAALLPGGPYARILAGHAAVVMVGDTVFAHGGVMPNWAGRGLDRINREVACWLAGAGPLPAVIDAADGPLWSRHYSMPPERCELLAQALDTLGAARMVVAHTPQEQGITSACDGKVWRIDVGMAAHYGGPTQVLEIRGAEVRALAVR